MNASDWIWKNGGLIPWAEATTHVMTHALHYGSSIFEGIRVYATGDGPRFFGLFDGSTPDDHGWLQDLEAAR